MESATNFYNRVFCDDQILGGYIYEIESRDAEHAAEFKRLAPLCEDHGTDRGGARSGCPYCGLELLFRALDRIDYLCGEPNDMECSGYTVHCDESLVVAAVERHSAALVESQKRVAELEAEVESLNGGVNARSMRMNNRSLRMN